MTATLAAALTTTFVTALAATLVLPAAVWSPPFRSPRAQPPSAPMVISASPTQPVLTGMLVTEISRPAERMELVIAAPAQPTVEANRAVTEALMSFVQRVLPGRAVSAQTSATVSNGFSSFSGGPYGAFVSVYLPGRTTDPQLREVVTHFMSARNQLDWSDPNSRAKIVSLGHGYGSCEPFVSEAVARARLRVSILATALGTASDGALELGDLSRGFRVDGPQSNEPLCGRDQHAAGATALGQNTVASFTQTRTYDFAQPLHFNRHFAATEETVANASFFPNQSGVRLRLHADKTLLTLEGRASAKHSAVRLMYEYTGPNGRSNSRASRSESHVGEIRRRLEALDIPAADVAAQLDPFNGNVYVAVQTGRTQVDDAVVGAIAGTDPIERAAVLTQLLDADCEAESHTIARAAGNAAARANRLATALGTTADTHPVALQIENPPLVPCRPQSRDASLPTRRRLSGRLRLQPRQNEFDRAVFATFTIGTPQLSGVTSSAPASDDADSFAARLQYIAPPIDYPDSSVFGEAALETRLRPETVAIGLNLSPDNHNNFRAIDPAFVPILSAELGASEADYSASFIPGMSYLSNGDREPDTLSYTAVLPYRGESTARAATTALHSLRDVGYGGFDVLAQRGDCAQAAEALARDAIRAAAAKAHARRGARLVAIDLRGPVTVDGTCRPGFPGAGKFSVRSVTIPDVRLAAYARVSFGR